MLHQFRRNAFFALDLVFVNFASITPADLPLYRRIKQHTAAFDSIMSETVHAIENMGGIGHTHKPKSMSFQAGGKGTAIYPISIDGFVYSNESDCFPSELSLYSVYSVVDGSDALANANIGTTVFIDTDNVSGTVRVYFDGLSILADVNVTAKVPPQPNIVDDAQFLMGYVQNT
ncbi:hypothetical protein BDQ12DRAFT_723664 [Crucibulum laeve]|uniref:Uncharacterized protein n=1 Tax=Crucibulum laeve TaxID=68775 RepID=A0A5C3LXD9_9AGAR|nr:hypothetical protein BDQ12DRAFT_723664 [Crucibulum laeve]